MRRSKTAALLSAAAFAAAIAAGCGDDKNDAKTAGTAATGPKPGEAPNLAKVKVGDVGPQLAGSYVGVVEKTDAYFAVAARDGKAIAFMTDGRGFGEQFTGKIDKDGTTHLTSAGQAKLDLKVGAKRAAGAIRLNGGKGEPLRITAARSTPTAGYYRGRRTFHGDTVHADWVVLNNGGQHGLVRVGGRPRGAPSLARGSKQVVISGLGRISVHRVTAPGDEQA